MVYKAEVHETKGADGVYTDMPPFQGVETVCLCGNSNPETYIELRGEDGTICQRQCANCEFQWTTEDLLIEGIVSVHCFTLWSP